MVSPVGIEPTTNWLKANCSTTELRALELALAPADVIGVPNGIRTRVGAVKGRCPGPLDDGDQKDIRRSFSHASGAREVARYGPLPVLSTTALRNARAREVIAASGV